MVRWCLMIIAFAVLVPTCACAQSQPIDDLLDYLVIPETDCNFLWCHDSSFFDPLLANPQMSFVELHKQHEKWDRVSDVPLAKLKLDLSRVCSRLDSVGVAQQYAEQARQILEQVYANQKTAETAYLLGIAFDRLDKDKIARQWYEKAYEHDHNHYRTCFEVVTSLEPSEEKDLRLWTKRARELAERLMEPENDPPVRADVAYEYAMVLMHIGTQGGLKDFFTTMADVVKKPSKSDGGEEAMFLKIFGTIDAMGTKEVAGLLKTAADIEPTNARYQLSYAAAEIGRILFANVKGVLKEEKQVPNASEKEAFQQIFGKNKEEVFAVRQRLLLLPMVERDRYPAINLYLADVNFILEDYQIAYDELLAFIQAQPAFEPAYAFLCGLSTVMMLSNEQIREQILNRLMSITEKKCADLPTFGDCYRLGALYWMQGDLHASINAFQKALMSGEDVRPRIATAIALLQLGDDANARTIAESLKRTDPHMSGSNGICYNMLRAIIAASDNDLPSALFWAEKAAVEDTNDKLKAKALLAALRNR